MKDIWNELLEFESKDLITSFFKERHSSDINDWKVQEIASNFVQGREYFRSARDASIIVKPLLLYYGIISLSRALVFILNPKLSENKLRYSHGLEIKNWPGVVASKDFEKIAITVTQGGFSELVNATNNENYLRVNSSAVDFKSGLKKPVRDYMISLKDVFQFLPDLRNEFKIWTGTALPFAQLAVNGLTATEDKVSLRLVGEPSDEMLNLIFPTSYCHQREIVKRPELTVNFKNENWTPNFTQKWFGAFDLGDVCVVPVLRDDIGFNLLSTMYIISYTFGMMARYFPTTWISLGRVQKGDKIFPLINKSLKIMEQKFPETVLDFLRAPYPFEERRI